MRCRKHATLMQPSMHTQIIIYIKYTWPLLRPVRFKFEAALPVVPASGKAISRQNSYSICIAQCLTINVWRTLARVQGRERMPVFRSIHAIWHTWMAMYAIWYWQCMLDTVPTHQYTGAVGLCSRQSFGAVVRVFTN